jgi:CzcA family heavy metal efflux pump
MKNFFFAYRSPIAFVMAVIVAAGVYSYTQIKTSLFPEVTFPKLKVIADNGEQPVDKMMVTVTRPLEDAIKRVPNLQMLRSTTSRGNCELSAYMQWGTDMDNAQGLMESHIGEIMNQLPAGTKVTVEKMAPSILPVSGYTLESNTRSPIELRLIANYIVKPFLSHVEGVSTVAVIGGKTKEYWITLHPAAMTALSITPDTINQAFSQTNFINSNGYMADYRRLYLTLTDAGLYSKSDLENVVIKNNGKRIIQLKDIATVDVGEKIERIKINANGREAVLVNVVRQPGANLVDLSTAMNQRIEELKKVLPKGVTIKPYYKQSDFVKDAIRSVGDSLWIGLFLAIIVSVIFLHSFKASSTILLTIPVTLGLTLTVLYAFGFTFNIMTLGAIAASIGLIIDDAIVVVEQIHRTHEEFPDESSTILVRKAIHYLFPAMVGSSISTIVIFIPFVLMTGIAGAYFNILTETMIITLVCSFVVSWIGLPVIYILLGRKKPRQGIRHSHPVKPKNWVAFFIKRPVISLLLVGGMIMALIIVYPKLETDFLPQMDEGSIVLDYSSPAGTSLEETDRMLREVEKIIVKIPEVASYSRRTGTQMGFFITEPNRGDYLIQLKKKRSRTTEEVIDDIRRQIENTQPALRVDFGQVIEDMLGDLMTSVQPIEIKIFGDNQQRLNDIARQVAREVDKVRGTADVFNGIVIAGPSIDIKPDARRLAQYGMSPANLQFQLETQTEGNIIGGVLEKEQATDIRLLYPRQNQSLDWMKQANIFIPGGKLKPLSEVAHIEVQTGVAEIQRQDLHSMSVVTSRLNGRDLGSTMREIQQRLSKINLPQGYYISYGGAYAEQTQSFKELLTILITAILLVFAVMLFLFRRLGVAFIILLIAALGATGSFLALYLTGTPLNVGSYTGVIMIVGIIGENAIFTYQQFAANLIHSGNADEAIVYSISTRLRPKLMTAIGAIVALTPLALGIGTGAQLHQPLAIAVIGGFIAALPLLLIVLPSLLRLQEKIIKPSKHVEKYVG